MKTYKPYTKSRRHTVTINYRDLLTKSTKEKSLVSGFTRGHGRNNRGRITTRHKGGGNKRLFRDVDFTYDKKNIPAKLASIEYDPNRSGFVGVAVYADGEKRYVLVPKSMKAGEGFVVAENAPVAVGNRLALKNVPVGTFVYNVELKPLGGAKMARSAGNFVEVIAQDGGYTLLKLPSTEVRKVKDTCYASIGSVSNDEHHLVNFGKAGRSRWRGIRPTVRGTAMNPVDHPYGGGEGRQGRGRRRALTLWGKPVGKGQKSRRSKKYSNKWVVSRRKVGKQR